MTGRRGATAFARVPVKTFDPPVERLPDAEMLAASLVHPTRVDPKLFAMMPSDRVTHTVAGLLLWVVSATHGFEAGSPTEQVAAADVGGAVAASSDVGFR